MKSNLYLVFKQLPLIKLVEIAHSMGAPKLGCQLVGNDFIPVHAVSHGSLQFIASTAETFKLIKQSLSLGIEQLTKSNEVIGTSFHDLITTISTIINSDSIKNSQEYWAIRNLTGEILIEGGRDILVDSRIISRLTPQLIARLLPMIHMAYPLEPNDDVWLHSGPNSISINGTKFRRYCKGVNDISFHPLVDFVVLECIKDIIESNNAEKTASLKFYQLEQFIEICVRINLKLTL